MMRSQSAVFLLIVVLSLGFGCGNPNTPGECLKEADRAFFTDKDYDKASELYAYVMGWKQEGVKPTEDQRFEASLKLVRCKIFNKDFKGALSSAEGLKNDFPNMITCKNYGTIITEFAGQDAKDEAVQVVAMASQQFPEAKGALDIYVKALMKKGLSDKQFDILNSLGYFGK